MSTLNPGVLVSVHCYAGDRGQVETLMPMFEHHQAPVIIVSPVDSQVLNVKSHHTVCAGGVGYIGAVSWERQRLQLEKLLTYPPEFQWFLLNDADSFVITPKLPSYLFENESIVWGNKVTDFRVPGQSWQGMPPWPKDYHRGFELAALQPPYFMSRSAMAKVAEAIKHVKLCPTTPFIDWVMIAAPTIAGLKTKGFHTGASCETVTPNGKAVMAQCVGERGATFLHAIKTQEALDICLRAREAYKRNHGVA